MFRDLHERVAEGLFREDLLYRVNVVNITVPPLRRRLADIRPLANRFIAQAAETHHRTVTRVAEGFYQALERYEWPGNIRQLRNVVEAAVLLCTDPELTAQSVSLPAAPPRGEGGPESFELPEGMTLEQLERAVLMKTLQRYQGNRTLTAERPAFWSWIEMRDCHAKYDDNFVHLSPHLPVRIRVTPMRNMRIDEFREALRVRSMWTFRPR